MVSCTLFSSADFQLASLNVVWLRRFSIPCWQQVVQSARTAVRLDYAYRVTVGTEYFSVLYAQNKKTLQTSDL